MNDVIAHVNINDLYDTIHDILLNEDIYVKRVDDVYGGHNMPVKTTKELSKNIQKVFRNNYVFAHIISQENDTAVYGLFTRVQISKLFDDIKFNIEIDDKITKHFGSMIAKYIGDINNIDYKEVADKLYSDYVENKVKKTINKNEHIKNNAKNNKNIEQIFSSRGYEEIINFTVDNKNNLLKVVKTKESEDTTKKLSHIDIANHIPEINVMISKNGDVYNVGIEYGLAIAFLNSERAQVFNEKLLAATDICKQIEQTIAELQN